MDNYPSGLPPGYTSQFTSDFWWRMAIFLIGSAVVIFIVNTILRKTMGVKRKPFFSYGHVNEKHQKIDWSIRILMVLAILVSAIFALGSLQIYMLFIFIIFGGAQEIVRAVMEKKYARNPKDYLFTLIRFPLAIMVIFGLAYWTFPDTIAELLTAY